MVWFLKWSLRTLLILVQQWIWRDMSMTEQLCWNSGQFAWFLPLYFGTQNFAVVCEENTVIGERRKTLKFSNESEVYEVICSNQKTPHSLKGCFETLSGKYFIRRSGERAQILTPPLPPHLLICTVLSHHAHNSSPGHV